MKKIILLLSLLTLVYSNEKSKDVSFDVNKDFIYNGCRDTLANKWTDNRMFLLGLGVAQKDATLSLLELMSMRVVNGTDMNNVCKFYLDLVLDKDFSTKYIKSSEESRLTFLNIVERDVVKSNGEDYENFSENLKRIRKLFK